MADPHTFPRALVDEDPAAPTVADLYGELDADRTTEVMTVNIGPHHRRPTASCASSSTSKARWSATSSR